VKEIILLKEGEIALKGLNKKNFEDALIKNVRRRLKSAGNFKYASVQSTVYIEPLDGADIDEALHRCSKVFGAAALCKAAEVIKDIGVICESAVSYLKDKAPFVKTFKVEAKRADKGFALKSPEICAVVGQRVIEEYPFLKVDAKNPDILLTVEIRDSSAYIHAGNIPGAGGIPVGMSGRALVLLSGGIDSPVAAYMTAKRGVRLSAAHFVSPPYTSERARLKVEKLCEALSEYCGGIALYCVPFTKIQETLRENCPEGLFTVVMRRIMFIIAQKIAAKNDIPALVTGESIGQVASQTMDAIVCTDAVCAVPVFRPVIGMDKNEIITLARKIGTLDISNEPYEDCCTVFTPKHPKTRPSLGDAEAAQKSFDYAPLIEAAANGATLTYINPSAVNTL